MNLLIAVRRFFTECGLNEKSKILIGVSGGADSMVLAEVLISAGFTVGIAHCNFGLRGEESEGDMEFTQVYFSKSPYQLPVFTARFETLAFARQHDFSIQEAARILRYQFWNEISELHAYDYIATAHHRDDGAETSFYGLLRSRYPEIIPVLRPVSGKVIRPFSDCSRAAIRKYAEIHHIPFREDSSNLKDDYARNFIRLRAAPLLQELNPDWSAAMRRAADRAADRQTILREIFEAETRKRICRKTEGTDSTFTLEINGLEADTPFRREWLIDFTLYELKWEFSYAERIGKLISGPVGKILERGTERLIRERCTLAYLPDKKTYFLPETELITDGKVYRIEHLICRAGNTPPDEKQLLLFTHHIQLAGFSGNIKLRLRQPGDRFTMPGRKHSEKIKDLLNKMHYPVSERDRVWLLTDEEKIVYFRKGPLSRGADTADGKFIYFSWAETDN